MVFGKKATQSVNYAITELITSDGHDSLSERGSCIMCAQCRLSWVLDALGNLTDATDAGRVFQSLISMPNEFLQVRVVALALFNFHGCLHLC